MKNLTLTIICLALILSVKISGAQNITGASQQEIASLESEPMNGYWELSNSTSQAVDMARITKWTTGDNLVALSVWKDILNIEHTVSSSFKWDTPPSKLMPGIEIQMAGKYENVEYSTPNRVLTGIKIMVDKAGTNFMNSTSNAIQVVNLNKDNKQHSSELQNGKFLAPKHFIGEGNEIVITVDCFIGKDHYVSTYTYTFVESSSL
jgi:hypothetical protein